MLLYLVLPDLYRVRCGQSYRAMMRRRAHRVRLREKPREGEKPSITHPIVTIGSG
jgi:hypothetical protein